MMSHYENGEHSTLDILFEIILERAHNFLNNLVPVLKWKIDREKKICHNASELEV